MGRGRGLVAQRSGTDADHPPAAGIDGLYTPCEPVADRADEQVAHWGDHQEQAEGVADEPRYADHDPAYEDDQPVEKLPRW